MAYLESKSFFSMLQKYSCNKWNQLSVGLASFPIAVDNVDTSYWAEILSAILSSGCR